MAMFLAVGAFVRRAGYETIREKADRMMRNRNQANHGGEYRKMVRFELDRLFGWALTDSRFFRQLRDDPYRAIAEFDLTEEETQAVLSIAPFARSTEDLAMQLDAWMTGSETDAVTVRPAERTTAAGPVLGRLPLASRTGHERHAPGQRFPNRRALVHSGDDEQRVCLTLNERTYRN